MILTGENCIWSTGGMILTGGNKSPTREMCPTASLSTTNPTHTGAGSKPVLCNDSLVTNCLSHDTVHKAVRLNVIRIYVIH